MRRFERLINKPGFALSRTGTPAGWLFAGLAAILLMVSLASAQSPPDLAVDADSIRPHASVGYWLDPSGLASLRDVAARLDRFQPLPAARGEDINFGYHHGAVWLHFELTTRANTPADWLLEVAHPTLDRVEVYLVDARGSVIRQQAGDRLPMAERPFRHRNLVFPLRFTPSSHYHVWLRVESEGNLTIPLRLWRPAALANYDRVSYAWLALYFGVLSAMILYNLLLLAAIRDRLYLLYVGVVTGMGVGLLALSGFGNLWLWPGLTTWGHYAYALGFAFCGLMGALFTRRFLATRRYTPWLDGLIRVSALLFALILLLSPFVPYLWLAIAANLTGIAFSSLGVLAGVRGWQRGSPGARVYLLAWAILLAGVSVLASRNMGWLPTNWLTSYLVLIGSALDMILLSFALAARINRMRQQKEDAEARMLREREEVLQIMSSKEAQLEAMVEKRTRDLAIINEGLRESVARERRQAHHDALTGLANRMLLDDRLEQALKRARRAGTKVAVALIDLNDFKPINDTYGHDVGDQLLVDIANRLRLAVRVSDTIARYGGDEFVLVLDSLHDRDEAEHVLHTLMTSLREPFRHKRLELPISAAVGVCLFPDDAEEANTLLRCADEAMYQEKRRKPPGKRRVGT